MPLHVTLDYTVPFVVGDSVCTTFPPGGHEYTGGPASYDCLEAKISSLKLVLEHNHENSCLVKEPLTEKELKVETVIYTIVPLPRYHLSPFMVECHTKSDSHPMLFASEEELRAYQQSAKA